MNSHLNTESQIHILSISNTPFHPENTRVNFRNTFSTPLLLPNENYEIGLKTIGFDLKFHEKDISKKLFSFPHDIIQFEVNDSMWYHHNHDYEPDTKKTENFYAIESSEFDDDMHTYPTFIKTLNNKMKALFCSHKQRYSHFSCVENSDGSFTFSCRLRGSLFKSIIFSEEFIKLLKLEKLFTDRKWRKIDFTEKLKYWRFSFATSTSNFLMQQQQKPKQRYFFTLELNSVIRQQITYTNLPKFIIVKLHELTSTAINFGDNEKIITMLPITKKNISADYTCYKYENVNNTFHKIKTKNSEIHGFEITLENENHELLKLQPGQPTIIQFLLKEMSVDHHIIRVSSQPSQNFPDNTAANFTVDLQHLHNVIENYHDYEIGLHSIFLPKLLSLTENINDYFYIVIQYCSEIYKVILDFKHSNFELTNLFIGEIPTQTKRQSPLELTFSKRDTAIDTLFITINRHKREDLSEVRNNISIDKYSTGEMHHKLKIFNDLKIHLSPYLWYILTNKVVTEDKEIYSGEISDRIGNTFEVDSTVDDFELNFNIKDRLTPHFCLLNCDAINPHIVCETYDQILQCIPLDVVLTAPHSNKSTQLQINKELNAIDSYYYYRPEEISYYSLCKILNMQFCLQDTDGNQLSFRDKQLHTYLTLNLKRKMK